MNEKLTGIAFAIFGLAMILMSPVTGWLCEKFENRYILQWGLIVESIALFFSGPDFFLPDLISLILIGQVFLGMAESMILIPVTPEIIDSCSDMIRQDLVKEIKVGDNSLANSQELMDSEEVIRLRFEKCRGVLTDKASVLTNLTFAVGSIFGPILGGGLT